MSGSIQFIRGLMIVVTAVISVSAHTTAQQIDVTNSTDPLPQADRASQWALIHDIEQPAQVPKEVSDSEPLPFASSIMAADAIPPYLAHPELTTTKTVSYEVPVQRVGIDIPVDPSSSSDPIAETCRELTAMIAGNLDSDISKEAKVKMIETALKLVARNVTLTAEAEITRLKADHALEVARMQGQMMHMRTAANSADQINRVAGPLYKMLDKNFRQAQSVNLASQQIAQMMTEIGMDRLETEAREARENRKRITLTSPPAKPEVSPRTDSMARTEIILSEIDRLKRRLDAELQQQQRVSPANYNQPLQPRRQPLEPIRRVNQYYQNAKNLDR